MNLETTGRFIVIHDFGDREKTLEKDKPEQKENTRSLGERIGSWMNLG